MPENSNHWILTKSCDFAPDGSLQLGQILAEPKDPAYVLQPYGPLAFPEGMKIEHGRREGLSMQTKGELSAHFLAWAQGSILSAGQNADATRKSSNQSAWHFRELETHTMTPSLAYIELAVRHGDVEASLRRWRWRRRLYMVTGVRIARGARMRRLDGEYSEFEAAMQAAVPEEVVILGAKAMLGQKQLGSEMFDKASDFVFAYRLNEISYGTKIVHRPYKGGEMASADAPDESHEPRVVVDDFEVLGLVDIPFGGNSTRFEMVPIPGHEELQCYTSKE
ncbi:hypothetical protein V8C26DRAFT_402604 [Trichoderma gracile]